MQVQQARERAAATLEAAGLKLTPEEREGIEVVDFARNVLEDVGAQIVVYVNTERICAKEIVLFPNQTCAEHRRSTARRHDGQGRNIPGPSRDPEARPARADRGGYTAAREIVLNPASSSRCRRNTLHWFQAGPEGAIVSEFSTRSREDLDVFTDPEMARATVVAPEPPRPNSAP
jgi:D-lyxose ketol-isomerase